MTDLLELIQEDKDAINVYLAEVTAIQFIEDVKTLTNKNITQSVIEDAINKLQSLI